MWEKYGRSLLTSPYVDFASGKVPNRMARGSTAISDETAPLSLMVSVWLWGGFWSLTTDDGVVRSCEHRHGAGSVTARCEETKGGCKKGI